MYRPWEVYPVGTSVAWLQVSSCVIGQWAASVSGITGPGPFRVPVSRGGAHDLLPLWDLGKRRSIITLGRYAQDL